MSVGEITVVCDSPKHARGKVAKIATYRRDGNSDSWTVGRSERVRQLARRRGRLEASGLGNDKLDQATQVAVSFEPLECKLCGLKLSPREVPLRDVLNLLAAQGEPRISLKKLILVASRQKGQ